MSKRILAIHFSQTGQLTDILSNLTAPLTQAGHSVEFVRVEPQEAFPFPWTGKSFFAVMPDCVTELPAKIKPFQLKETNYDLIIFGYQAWFLSPSTTANAILCHPSVMKVLADTPVVTITGARNMWIMAMERIKEKIKSAGGLLKGHIALTDNHANFVSFITIFYWMFAGKKDRYLSIFPKPGVADEDIAGCSEFGKTINQVLESRNWDDLQPLLISQKAVQVKYRLMFIERKAKKIFKVWAGIITKKKNRTPWLVAFKYYLIIALFVAAPIILTVDAIFFKPFLKKRISQQLKYYSGVN